LILVLIGIEVLICSIASKTVFSRSCLQFAWDQCHRPKTTVDSQRASLGRYLNWQRSFQAFSR